MLTQIPAGYLAQRFGPKLILLVNLAGTACCFGARPPCCSPCLSLTFHQPCHCLVTASSLPFLGLSLPRCGWLRDPKLQQLQQLQQLRQLPFPLTSGADLSAPDIASRPHVRAGLLPTAVRAARGGVLLPALLLSAMGLCQVITRTLSSFDPSSDFFRASPLLHC